MAAKKRSASSTAKVAAKKAAPKKAAKSASTTSARARTSGPKAGAAKKAAGAKKAAIRLTDKQRELLQQVASKGAGGHEPAGAAETRSLEALKDKKVVKKLAKNKETGKVPYAVTKTGEKALASG